MSLSVSAPGKIILFGEHSVVFRQPAMAVTTDSLRTYLKVSPHKSASHSNVISLHLRDFDFVHSFHDSVLDISSISNPLHKLAASLFINLFKIISPDLTNLSFEIRSNLPIGSGLGSSASISVCISAALLILSNKISKDSLHIPESLKLIDHYAFIGEKFIHGNPSGLDNNVITYGNYKLLHYPEPIPNINFSQLNVLLINTNIQRSTKSLVSNVNTLKELYPDIINPILESMGAITIKAISAIQSNSITDLLQLIRINQSLLKSLKVSIDLIDDITNTIHNTNLGEAKITGAGGGGCILVLTKKSTDLPILKDLLLKKFENLDIMQTILGGNGIRLEPINND